MGSSQRLAAVAAVSHARHYYNHTQTDLHTSTTQNHVNVFFVSATLCGVLVAVCAACWRRSPDSDKPEEVVVCRRVYTISADSGLSQTHEQLVSPPPAYDTVVDDNSQKDGHPLQEVVTEPCPRCLQNPGQPDGALPSYEAAVLLRDTKL